MLKVVTCDNCGNDLEIHRDMAPEIIRYMRCPACDCEFAFVTDPWAGEEGDVDEDG